ncbi:MAG: retention module-containing protein [Desulfobacteraceae bacterium]|nr:MAG: retention module-containing protein [Desulfobacteraceae bacterium]
MAKSAGTENQVVGKVFILYGTVKAVAPDGTVRVLAPNSPIYANEQIITGSDGSVSIQFSGPPVTQLDLGRMMEIIIDEDVYAGVAPEVITEAAAEAEKIQEALLAGDGEINLEATAAGGEGGAGGGHPVVSFDLTGNEVTPGSGAGTTGITTTGVGTLTGTAPYVGVVTLTATESITEAAGQVITYTATVDNAPQGSDLVLTLSNGGIITILVGETSGSVDGTSSGDEDVYIDPENLDVSIAGATGGNYDSLDISDTAGTAVTDTIDTTYVTLSAGDVNEDAQGVTFTAVMTNPGETDVTITTNLGNIFIAAGETTGTLFVSTADPDVYIDSSGITATISAVTGGNFEAVDFENGTAVVQITDTIDTTTVSLSGPESVNEGESATYTVSVDHAPETDMTVNVSYSYISAETEDIVTNTAQVTIQAGQTSTPFSVDTVNDSIFEGTETFAVSISDPQGGNFENLVLGNASVETDILDNDRPPENDPPLDGDEAHFITGSNDGYFYPDENEVTGNALTNASDPDGNPLTVSAGTGMIPGTYGDLVLESNGSYVYTLHPGIPALEGSASDTFHYTVSDGEGGTNDSSITINLTANESENDFPEGGVTAAFVDDEGLADGIPGGLSDYTDTNADGDNNEATFSGTLQHTIGDDGYGSVTFADMDGLTGTVGTETVTYGWSGDTLTATVTGGDRDGTDLFTVKVDADSGDYTVTQLDNVLHVFNGMTMENNARAALTYTVTDGNGDEATGTLNITFDDDMPGMIPDSEYASFGADGGYGVESNEGYTLIDNDGDRLDMLIDEPEAS